MANYEASARSNYVKIKPGMEEEFEDFCAELGWEVSAPDTRKGREGMVCLTKYDGGIPTFKCMDKDGNFLEEDEEVLWEDYAKFLDEGSILHIVEQGYEKLRYLTGFGVWVFPNGKYYEVNIHEPPPVVKRFARKNNITITDNSY